MDYSIYDDIEIDYIDDLDYEEDRKRESTMLNRRFILAYEKQYNCTFPEFILIAQTEKERIDLMLWASSIRYLTVNNERVYEPINSPD